MTSTSPASACDWCYDADRLTWPRPRRVELGLGLDVRYLGDLEHRPAREALAKPRPPRDDLERGAIAFYLQSTGAVGRQLYAGLNLSLGRPYTVDTRAQTIAVDPDEVFYAASGVLTLVLAESPVVAKAELIAGVYGIASHHNAWNSTHEPMLEPRLAAELPLSPQWSLGIHLGWDLVRLEDQLLGLYLNMRSHAPGPGGYDPGS